MASLDIFNDDAFSVTSLTLAINETPFVPNRIAQLGLFEEEGIASLSVAIERTGSGLSLIPAVARGTPGKVVTGDKRSMISLNAIHLPQRATIGADEIQNVRAFGKESELETVQNVVNKRLKKMRRDLDLTIEYQRIGAIKGLILDADGTTPLVNLFEAFDVTQQSHGMVFGTATTKVRNKVVEAKRKVEAALGGLSYRGLRALCSPGFFDAMVAHPAVEAAYDRWNNGEFLREDLRGGFPFAGVLWEEYRGKVGSIDFIADGESYLIPEGVPDLFVTNYAPADYMETANTIGYPYYTKQEALRMNKGIEIESQSNPISICSRPQAIIRLQA
jgi:hypothetical protein